MKNVKVELFEISVVIEHREKTKATGEETAKLISEKSPERTGEYKKGWQSDYDTITGFAVVHNIAKPTLTHLLENGHLTRSKRKKKRVKPQPHIRPSYETMARKYIDEMKKVNIEVKVKKI